MKKFQAKFLKKFQIILFFSLFTLSLSAQHSLSLNGGMGYADMQYATGKEILRVDGWVAEIGVLYHYKKFGLGLNVPMYNHANFENPDNLELLYTPDIAFIGYRNPLFQQTTNITYFTASLYAKYDISFLKKLKLRVATGVSRIKGRSNQVTLTAPGNLEPTVVSYNKSHRSEWGRHHHASLMYNITPSVSAGVKVSYQTVVKYWGGLFYFECRLF